MAGSFTLTGWMRCAVGMGGAQHWAVTLKNGAGVCGPVVDVDPGARCTAGVENAISDEVAPPRESWERGRFGDWRTPEAEAEEQTKRGDAAWGQW